MDFEWNLAPQQSAREHPIQELVEKIEKERQQQTDHGVLDVDAQAHRSRGVSDQCLDNAVHAQRLLDGQRVLRQADEGADKKSADLAAAHQREIDGGQQGQLQVSQNGDDARNIDLEENTCEGTTHNPPAAK